MRLEVFRRKSSVSSKRSLALSLPLCHEPRIVNSLLRQLVRPVDPLRSSIPSPRIFCISSSYRSSKSPIGQKKTQPQPRPARVILPTLSPLSQTPFFCSTQATKPVAHYMPQKRTKKTTSKISNDPKIPPNNSSASKGSSPTSIDKNSPTDSKPIISHDLRPENSGQAPAVHTVAVPDSWVIGERIDKYLMAIKVNERSLSRGLVQKLVKEGQITVNSKSCKSGYKVKPKDLIQIPNSIFFQPSDSDQTESSDTLMSNNNENDILTHNISNNSLINNISNNNNNNNVITISQGTNDITALPDKTPLTFPILFEDLSLLILNKPAGVLVHPSPGHTTHTVVTSLLATHPPLSVGEDPSRPGVVHRLDRDTSGILVIARSADAHARLKEQFQEHSLVKKYSAVVWGVPPGPKEGCDTVLVDKPLARHPKEINKMVVSPLGKEARTEYSVVWSGPLVDSSEEKPSEKKPSEKGGSGMKKKGSGEKKKKNKDEEVVSLLDVRIHTGRTHQIRVHLASVGCPIVGDPIYGPKKKLEAAPVPGLMLAATSLELAHPITSDPLKFGVDMPPHMQKLLENQLQNVNSKHTKHEFNSNDTQKSNSNNDLKEQ